MTLLQLLKTGAVLRYRDGFGFYAVKAGRQSPVDQSQAEAALRSGQVRPEGRGPDQFGVRHFALTNKECRA